MGEARIRLLDIDPIPETICGVDSISILAGRASGILLKTLVVGSPVSASYVLFHVPNARAALGEGLTNGKTWWRGRTVLEGGDWRVLLDSAPRGRELIKELRGVGGYRFTHVGRLERLDGAPSRYHSESSPRERNVRWSP